MAHSIVKPGLYHLRMTNCVHPFPTLNSDYMLVTENQTQQDYLCHTNQQMLLCQFSVVSVTGFYNQGVSRVVLPLKALGENPFLASSSFQWLLVFLVLCPHDSSLSASVVTLCSCLLSQNSYCLSYKDTCNYIQGPSG